jgi:hypothetical protein
MDFCVYCVESHEPRVARPIEPDPDGLFGDPTTTDGRLIPDLIPIDVARRIREEFEVDEGPVVPAEG